MRIKKVLLWYLANQIVEIKENKLNGLTFLEFSSLKEDED